MHNLTAQVTSSLLPFPRVTVDALREDEITLDLVLHGRFTVGKFVANQKIKNVHHCPFIEGKRLINNS